MIGMSQIKKRLFIGIAIGAGIGLVGILLTLWWAGTTVKSYEEGTNQDYIDTFTVNAVIFTKDVLQGETITEDMVSTARVHVSNQPQNPIGSAGSAVGKILKYNVSKNMPVTSNMISDKIIASDVRVQEISQILLPTDIREKDFVDFRMKMPSGSEYVVLAQKQIQKIIGNTMWLNLSEAELHIINAATVDAYVNPGIVFYAAQYADPQTQIKLDTKEASDKAKDFLAMKILEDAKAGKLPTKEPVVNTTQTQTTETPDTTVNPVEQTPSPELVEFKDKISALLLKYAMEYRYYIEAQNKVIANYQPNTVVMAHMKQNKYIVDQATEKLTEEAREAMMLRNTLFEEENKDKLGAIVAGAQAAANSQRQMRTSVLAR